MARHSQGRRRLDGQIERYRVSPNVTCTIYYVGRYLASYHSACKKTRGPVYGVHSRITSRFDGSPRCSTAMLGQLCRPLVEG
jgi:hypothetical protein